MRHVSLVALVALVALGVGFFAGMWVTKSDARSDPQASNSVKRTGPAESYMVAALFEAGRSDIIARPVFALHSGVSIPVKNTAAHPLGFGRFELVGTMPTISHVHVPGKSFEVAMDGDRAFALTGDSIDPGETIKVFIAFAWDATEQGALIVRFNEN